MHFIQGFLWNIEKFLAFFFQIRVSEYYFLNICVNS